MPNSVTPCRWIIAVPPNEAALSPSPVMVHTAVSVDRKRSEPGPLLTGNIASQVKSYDAFTYGP